MRGKNPPAGGVLKKQMTSSLSSVLILKLGIDLPPIFLTFYQLYSNTETLPQDWRPPESIKLHHKGRHQSGLKPVGDFTGRMVPANSADTGTTVPTTQPQMHILAQADFSQ